MFSKPYDSYTDILDVIIEQLPVFHFSHDIHHQHVIDLAYTTEIVENLLVIPEPFWSSLNVLLSVMAMRLRLDPLRL